MPVNIVISNSKVAKNEAFSQIRGHKDCRLKRHFAFDNQGPQTLTLGPKGGSPPS